MGQTKKMKYNRNKYKVWHLAPKPNRTATVWGKGGQTAPIYNRVLADSK